MQTDEIIGSIGVFVLLLAYALNACGRLEVSSRIYQVMNAGGAGLACVASLLINYLPFVVLEGAWCALALAALMMSSQAASKSPIN